MKTTPAALLVTAACLSAAVIVPHAQSQSQSQGQSQAQSQTQVTTTKQPEQRGQIPTFRTSVDLRQLDVTVLDKDRRPMRGLTAADFTVIEDGVPQKIDAFSFVEVPDAVSSETVWSTTATSDVVDNDLDSSRVFVLFIDDVWGQGAHGPLGVSDPWGRKKMSESVRYFVEKMGPDDIAAVVFPGMSRKSTPFTRDKAKLIGAIEWFADSNDTYSARCDTTPLAALDLAGNLASMKNRRKVIVYFGGGLQVQTKTCFIRYIWNEVFQVANESNVSFYPVDTMGLRIGNRIIDEYIVLAHHTGGKATINSNTFEAGLDRIYTENSSYYLLAYQPANPTKDGRFRQVRVRVNRAGAEVVGNRSYWAEKAPPPAGATGAAGGPAAPEPDPGVLANAKAIAELLPQRQIALRATAAPFRGDGDAGHVVSLAVGLSQAGFNARTRESVQLIVRILTADGTDFGVHEQMVNIAVPASPNAETKSEYEVLSRVEVPAAGRYELRVAVHSAATDRRGGVYVDVDVPDFVKDRMSLSGVTVSALPNIPAAPAFAVTGPAAALPTTVRAFAQSQRVGASLVIYQSEKRAPEPVPLEIQIQDAKGTVVTKQADTIDATRFGTTHAAPVDFVLPLSTLAPGKYLLTFRATLDDRVVTRDVQFTVK